MEQTSLWNTKCHSFRTCLHIITLIADKKSLKRLMMYLFSMFALEIASVYTLSMCVFAVRLMHPTSHQRLQPFASCTSEGIKSDE